MILNQELRVETLDPVVKRAFLGVPEKVLLAASVQLYKRTSRPLIDGARITPWWSFVQSTRLPSGMVVDGFRTSEERTARLGKSHRDFARARAAISGRFQKHHEEPAGDSDQRTIVGFCWKGERPA